MIRSLAWYCDTHYGVYASRGRSFAKPAPPADELLSLIGRPVKYFSRMTGETKSCLAAASLALREMSPPNAVGDEIGLLSAGAEGCVQANEKYFTDYVTSGRTMGRGNLFIYTLPTSTLCEVAIALALAGPAMYVHADASPLLTLTRTAEQLLTDREADGMLALWSDSRAAVCISLTAGPPVDPFTVNFTPEELAPLPLAERLFAMVSRP